MGDESDESQPTMADQVFVQPAAARTEAERVLADPAASRSERAKALASSGRAAYYDNRIHDAIELLEEAVDLCDNARDRAELHLLLAPALSKVGRSTEALALLDADGFDDAIGGTIHNQRGVVLAEIGRLPEALSAFESARRIHRLKHDRATEGRILVNMAAVASEMGDLLRSEAWYEEAWQMAEETGQKMAAAVIEGNLGYVASRKGDFGAALSWYGRARSSFSRLGDVDLLVAVLEVDHATTLLDLGLNTEAIQAANYALDSSSAGSNRMLEVQAMLLLGEAQLRLGQYRAAEQTLRQVEASARELKLRPWELRCQYLICVLQAEEGIDRRWVADVDGLAEGLFNAAWYREAARAAVVGARTAIDEGNHDVARSLLGWTTRIDDDRVDRIDQAHAEALTAYLDENHLRLDEALRRGFTEIERQQRLLTSAELEARLGHRARDLRNLALKGPLQRGDATAVLNARESGRRSRGRTSGARTRIWSLRSQLRDLRVGLQEARLGSRPTDGLERRVRSLEQQLLDASEDQTARTVGAIDPDALRASVGEATVLAYLEAEKHTWVVVVDGISERLVDLGPSDPVAAAARAQKLALRRMAWAAETDEPSMMRADPANARLDQLLVEPLGVDPERPVVIVPDRPVTDVSWAGLPSLSGRRFALATSVSSLLDSSAEPIAVNRVGLIDGGGLEHAEAEIDELESIWHPLQPSTARRATLADAKRTLESSALVHLAAHGRFRSENPFLSSLALTDSPLTLLDLEDFERLPSVVVMASCETGGSDAVGAELVGTTHALLSLGVEAVVAASVLVNDAASWRFMADLHRCLRTGSPLDESVRAARTLAIDRGSTGDLAAAQSFQVHGGMAAMAPLSLG